MDTSSQTDLLHSISTTLNNTEISLSTTETTLSSLIRPLLITISIIISYYLLKYFTSDFPPFKSSLKSLPGPYSTLPYIGRVHDVDRMHAWNSMKKFSDKYGGVFSLTLGGETHIWIAREDIAQDLLCKNAAICSARADLGAYPGVTKGFKYLPLLGYTEHLHRQRKFAAHITTRNTNAAYYSYISLETKRFLYELLQTTTTPSSSAIYSLTHLFCARISSRLAYGSDSSAPDHVVNAGNFIHQLGPSGPKTNLVPLLRYLPEWLVPDKKVVRMRQETEEKLWRRLFQEAKTKYKEGKGPAQTYVEASLRTRDGKREGEREKLFEDEEEAIFAVGMMCIVAVFTIAGPAVLFVMAMVLHPEWQEKVRREIDEVVEEEGLVELKHSSRLPMLRAAIKEAVRWKSTVPLGVPRLLEQDYTHSGYHFPKNAVVHVLDIAMSQDSTRYPSPETYNPGRWLDPSFPTFKAPLSEHPRLKGHHIFGRGRRVCPGQDFAEAELFVFCGNLLKHFTLGPQEINNEGKVEVKWPDPDMWCTDVIGGPLPFEANIKVRDEKRKAEIEALYREEEF